MLTGKTKNIGVIGCPIEHSLSPLMQNIAITDSGPVSYTHLDVYKRQVLGDLLVKSDHCKILLDSTIYEYVMQNFCLLYTSRCV